MITQKRLDDKDLEGLPGVGPATKNQLYKIGIRRISDLILFLPSFLIDKTQLTDIISVPASYVKLKFGLAADEKSVANLAPIASVFKTPPAMDVDTTEDNALILTVKVSVGAESVPPI